MTEHKLDDLAADIDDVTLDAEELTEDPPEGAKPKTLKKLHARLKEAAETIDELVEDATNSEE